MSQSEAPHNFTPLRIAGQGMCCALGFDTASTVAALRARLNHFQQTQLVGADGKPLIGAAVHDVEQWGAARLDFMLRMAVQDCLSRTAQSGLQAKPESTALWLVIPDATRATYPAAAMAETVASIVKHRGLHARSGCAAVGKGGIAGALLRLASVMDEQGADAPIHHLLLAGADSLLDAPTVEQMLAQIRLAHDGHTDALLPGEGAAVVWLTRAPGALPSCWVVSAAQAQDEWRLGGAAPLRAAGLTQAMREAAHAAGCAVADMEFHANGATGEDWCARETAMALSRAMERRREDYPQHQISQFLGETGAAAPVLTLAWLSEAMSRPLGTWPDLGSQGLAHFAGDDGQRSALVVQRRS
jgi:3-oxoacyl-[acyl-carrier-protein] synthase-1